MRNSLRFKFVVGFLVIFIPLVSFLLFNNLYATKVVREEVSKANSNLLAQQVNQIDKMMLDTKNYLKLLNNNETDIDALNFTDFNTDAYTIAKLRTVNRFRMNLNYFQNIDTLFIYNIKDKDLIFGSTKDYDAEQRMILEQIPAELAKKEEDTPYWQLVKSGSQYSLIKFVRLNDKFLAGAVVKTDSLVSSMLFLDIGQTGGASIISLQGEVASTTSISGAPLSLSKQKAAAAAITMKGKLYDIVTDPADNNKYLRISIPSTYSNILYVVLIPEGNMLQNLPFFKLAFYMIPLGGFLLLLFYLILLRNFLLKPMKILMKGMNRIMQGDLNIQLNENHSSEFAFLIGTFNNMVLQISRLKIDVYEEQIHSQEAGFRMLQMQIRPHFYLNSLNIIYSLAAIKEYALIQKMTQHLAEHFRFIIRTKQGVVSLEMEIHHIKNYLEIQKVRFPSQLDYEIDLPIQYNQCIILPLTIQTFVENAIIHGFVNRKELFTIRIRVIADIEEPNEFIWIIINDTGDGFQEELLLKLNNGTYRHEDFSEGHLGIQNVLQRQEIHYAGQAKLIFSNNQDHGAEVSIRIPLKYADDEVDEVV